MSVIERSILSFLKTPLFLFFATLLAACTSMEGSECLNANWHMLGVDDGSLGKPSQVELAKHTKACAKVNVIPEQQAYEAGHREGLLRYCIYVNGLKLGQEGQAMSVTCPEQTGDEFVRGYAKGREILRTRRAIDALNLSISDKQALLEDITSQVNRKQGKLQQESDAELRIEFLNDIKRLRLDSQLISQELHQARNQKQGVQQDLEFLLVQPEN